MQSIWTEFLAKSRLARPLTEDRLLDLGQNGPRRLCAHQIAVSQYDHHFSITVPNAISSCLQTAVYMGKEKGKHSVHSLLEAHKSCSKHLLTHSAHSHE